MLSKPCERCGITITAKYPSQLKLKRFCVKCGLTQASRKADRKVELKCIVCGKMFKVKRSHVSKRECCSRKCQGVIKSKKISGKNHPRWKEHKQKPKKYLWKGSQYLHRYLIEQHLGRKLRTDEVVHHINGDTLDNRIENLKLMTKSEHTRLHYQFHKQF